MTTILSRFQTLAAAAAAVLLVSCGGGDDGGINNNVAGVTSASAATPKYGQDLIITLQGRNLDKPILAQPGGDFVSGFSCSGIALSTEAPYVSNASTAYYRCTGPKVGDNSVFFVRPSDGVLLANVPFSTPVPQVTLTISNGAGVNGSLVLTLDPAKAPITVTNFLRYVNSGFYVDTVFHRNVPGFIIQGGGYAKPLVPNTLPLPSAKPPTYPAITLEDFNGLRNVTGTIAMARTNEPNSATSQFFINLADNPSLNGTGTSFGYAVFGSVTTGTELVTAMAAAPCTAWPDFLAGDAANACVPDPNLVVTAAVQTR